MVELDQLKICFLALTLDIGGAERQLYYILRVLKEKNADVQLLTLERGGFWENKIMELGITVEWVGQRNSKLLRLSNIFHKLRKYRPHIFQSQHLFANPYVAITSQLTGVKDIGAIRGDGQTGLDQVGRLNAYLCLHTPKTITANSRAAITNVSKVGVNHNRLYFLPNVVDTDHFLPESREMKSIVTVLGMGRLSQPKRFDRFLTIISQLQEDSSHKLKGLLVGDGPLKGDLENQALSLSLIPDTVTLLGNVDDPQRIYNQADIFLLTSDWEGTPNVVIEAMACGLPVVARNVGGVSEIIQHGINGYLFEPGDETNMLGTLLDLIDNPDLRSKIGSHAREFIVANHSIDRLPVYLSEIYSSVL